MRWYLALVPLKAAGQRYLSPSRFPWKARKDVLEQVGDAFVIF